MSNVKQGKDKKAFLGFDGYNYVTGAEEAAAASTPVIVTVAKILSAASAIVGTVSSAIPKKADSSDPFIDNYDTSINLSDADKLDDEKKKEKTKKILTWTAIGVGFTGLLIGSYFIYKHYKNKKQWTIG